MSKSKPTAESRPRYLPPPGIFLRVSSSIFFGWPPRSIGRDSTDLLDRHKPRPLLLGIENVPRTGGVLFVANHHQRENMWIGWVGAMLNDLLNGIRPARSPVRIVVTDSQRIKLFGREMIMPLSRFMYRRVAKFWQMIPIPADPTDTPGQATALRMTLHTLKEGLPVLFFPEGERGTAYRLVEALPGTGTFIALASRRAVILPCAIWEEGNLLRGQIAPPLTITSSDDLAVRQQVMGAISNMLPEAMRGAYSDNQNLTSTS